MRLITIKVPDNFNIFLVGCTHYTSGQCYVSGLDEFISNVLSSTDGLPISANRVVHHGDSIDAIPVNDKRWNPKNTSYMTPQEQALAYSKKMLPIKDNYDVQLDGNHEKKLWREYSPSIDICRELDCQYGSGTCVITYVDKNNKPMFRHYATHGRKVLSSNAKDRIQREANMKASLKLKLQNKMSNCILMSRAHIHRMLRVKPKPELCIVASRSDLSQKYTIASHLSNYIPPDHRWYVSTGSFYLTYGLGPQKESYAEDAEYDPVELGYYIVKVRNRRILSVKAHILGWSNLSTYDDENI